MHLIQTKLLAKCSTGLKDLYLWQINECTILFVEIGAEEVQLVEARVEDEKQQDIGYNTDSSGATEGPEEGFDNDIDNVSIILYWSLF